MRKVLPILKLLMLTVVLLLHFTPSFGQGYTGLIGRWPFNGSAADVSGHGFNGVIHGATPTTGSTGISNTAYHFNGSSSYITVPYNSMMNSKIHSICVKVKAHGFYSGTCQGNAIVWRGAEGSSTFSYDLEIFDNAWDNDCLAYSPTHECFAGGTGVSTASSPASAWVYTPPTDTGVWYCVVLTYDGDTTKVYVDGILKSRYYLHCNYNNSTDSLNFGKSEDGPPYEYFFNGDVDEIRLYNRVLTPADAFTFCDSMSLSVVGTTTCDSIILGDSVHICSGATTSLNSHMSGTATPDYIQWSPTTGLSSSTTLTPTLTAGPSSGWYHITTTTLLPGNLVTNGDFSAGNTGFSSAYTNVTGPGSLYPTGVYAISTNPLNEHPAAYSFTDHTSGSGNMMAINGASTPIDIWCETIPVAANTYYDLSAWFSNWSTDTVSGLPQIVFNINGVPLSSIPFTFVPTPGLWTQFHYLWYSGSTISATFCIHDQVTIASGNDFAIDDIQLRPVCTATDSIYVALNTAANIYRAKDTTVCVLTPHTLTAPAGHTNYLWNTGSTAASITVSGWGPYWVSSDSICTHFVDTFNFHPSPGLVVNLGNDTSLCNGSIMTIGTTPTPGLSYHWNTGSTSTSISISSAGTYWLQATNSIGCTSADTIHISLGTISVLLGNDTAACTGSSVVLSSSGTYMSPSYLWNTGATTSSIGVTTTGIYWLQVTAAGCSAADTVHIGFYVPVYANLGNDTVICKLNGSVVLTSAQTEAVYSTWSTGGTADTIHVAAAGEYWVEVNNHGCKTADSIYINIVDSPYAIPYIKPDLCVSDTTTLRISDQSGNIQHYYWSLGGATVLNTSITDTAGPFTVKWTDPGTYIISLSATTPEGCKSDTTYDTVHVHPLPVAGIIDTNRVNCANDAIVLRASVTDPGYFYTWLPGSFFDDPYAAVVTGHVLYSADVTLIVSTAFGCKAETFVTMQADSCCLLTLPAGFTPNNDGHNDLFRPVTKQNVVIEQFRIFNRWGNCVFESNTDNGAWDGTYKGEKQDMNVFYYYIKYTCSGAKRMQKGEVTLIR